MPLGTQNGLRLLQPGQSIVLQTSSSIYRGPYQSHVLNLTDAGVRIAIPVDQGKLILLPVGTSVVVTVQTKEGQRNYQSRVIERRAGNDRNLLLEAPIARPETVVERNVPVWTVTSGKGGVGKTTIICNLAIALAEQGRRVCVIDGDLGTANVDVMLNLPPKYTLTDVIKGNKHILEAVVEGPKGIIVLPGGSGLQELTELSEPEFEALLRQFKVLEKYTDLILIDTSSGLSRSVTNFIAAADQAILVSTPEPPAITDAYALVKVLARAGNVLPVRLIINRARTAQEAVDVADKMVFAAKRFLQYELQPIGHVSDDELVERSVREQVALVTHYAKSRAAQDLRDIAAVLLGVEARKPSEEAKSGPLSFLRRLRTLFSNKESDTAC